MLRLNAQNVPAIGGDFRYVEGIVHFREQNELHVVVCIDWPGAVSDQIGIPDPGIFFVLVPAGAAGDGHLEPVLGQPVEAFQGFVPGFGPTFDLVQRLGVVIKRNAQRELGWILLAQGQQAFAHLGAQHGLHGVGENKNLKPPLQSRFGHGQHIAVHKGFAASKADLARTQSLQLNFVHQRQRIGQGEVHQPVIAWAGFDIAVDALDVAQRAGVDPKRLQALKSHLCTLFPFGGHLRVGKLLRVQMRRCRACI